MSIDLLKQSARSLAQNRRVQNGKGPNLLLPRLASNEKILRDYNEGTLEVEKKRHITPAAEWLLDNFHLIEEQIRTAQRHLPRGFNRELPQLLNGPWASYPRVYEIALEIVSHTDGRIDESHLTGFIASYQEVHLLKLGELWAVPIMLRLALIENLRRVAVQLNVVRNEREAAENWANRIVEVVEKKPSDLIIVVGEMAKSQPVLNRAFVTEFLRRVQEKAPSVKLAVGWIEERLAEDGLTVGQMVQGESQYQAAAQVSVGNSIGSLRFLDSMDWQDFVEAQSKVEQTLRTDPAKIYSSMDFTTRDLYRHTVERVARHSNKTEFEVAALAIGLAQKNLDHPDVRLKHVGFFLTGRGLKILEREAQMRVSVGSLVARIARKSPLAFYLGGILAVTLMVTCLLLQQASLEISGWMLCLFGLLIFFSTSQLSVSLVNWFVTLFVPPSPLPRLDYSKGVPSAQATLVVVPTMLTGMRGIESLLEALEVRYLANCDKNIFFALLTDFPDASQEHMANDDDLVNRAGEEIQALNRKYKNDRPGIFYLFQRPRRWNPKENIWMGYERKRGKLASLNHLLRGGAQADFSQIIGDLTLLPPIKYVITLDTDTQLPRDAARQLAATMAHPLNLPIYDPKKGLIVKGYTILQPRVAISLPGATRSRYVNLFSGDPGIDPYTRTVSDVYQDVFHEGSFIGKGIYDVDAFERALRGKLPENRILSHDLLEGSYARAALVSDVQLFEEFPARYSTDTKRRHRWMRGDWQIASWLLPRLPILDARRAPNPLTGLSRWKIFDNLRRSLVPFAVLALLLYGWLLFPQAQTAWGLVILSVMVLPSLLTVLSELLQRSKDTPLNLHFTNVADSFVRQAAQSVLTVAFLPYDAVISLDAVARTLGRLLITRRHLLEWQTSSDSQSQDDGSLRRFVSAMACAPVLAFAAFVLLFQLGNPAWTVWGICALWAASPVIAWWISLPIKGEHAEFSAEELSELHQLSRLTWNFFETFVTDEDHWLPPDNFQEYPRPVIAHRTSPTNIGLCLLSTLAAHDFGYISLRGMAGRIASSLATAANLERHQGHFYNWYDTLTLKPMQPLYISTVDNGNLAGLLLTLYSGLLELEDQNWSAPKILAGLRDTLGILKKFSQGSETAAQLETLGNLLNQNPTLPTETVQLLEEAVEVITKLNGSGHEPPGEYERWRKILKQSCNEQRAAVLDWFPWVGLREQLGAHLNQEASVELKQFWSELNRSMSLRDLANGTTDRLAGLHKLRETVRSSPANPELDKILSELRQCVDSAGQNAQAMLHELNVLATRCNDLARMDFKFLYDPERELFSIGYNVSQHRLDGSCYDLLASEARLGSFVAIALGQVNQNHWFRLGRSLTSAGGKPALISWSGSMFEYLMPLLVMPTYDNTLLDLSCKSAVARQIQYGKQIKVPWGISESGYNLRDAGANYQYRAFGVPGLGFKRGLAHDIVIAPYATVMALMVAPEASCKNLKALRKENAGGRFGLYEALDYTASRIPNGQTHALVRSFMAHHQGMSLLSLTYTLLDRPMQRRFQANPLLKSAELLLHERVPRETSVLYPHELEANRQHESAPAKEATMRVFTDPNSGPPEVHLLSNGHYHVMITNTGGGCSRWNDTAITRWREDPTRDCWGTFVYLRDADSGAFWSPMHQPTLEAKPGFEAIFSQGRAEFRSRRQEIDMHTEIAVSPENDVEVRRITLMNHSDRIQTLEVTSYAEIVLNTQAADQAHPAFSNLFVQTQILPQQNAVVCSRRPRTVPEKLPWIAHLLLVHGNEIGKASFETDRAKFIGRGGNVSSPTALKSASSLSNTEGSVLDPIASIRRSIRLQPKESATVTLVSGIAPNREEILGLIAKYQDQTIANRCFELAWTHGMLMLRHLNTTEVEAQLYGRLAGALFYNQAARRANPSVLARNERGQ
ncbi:MAG: glucoamylase family protein, partial [Verrucomicrobiota bacterium]